MTEPETQKIRQAVADDLLREQGIGYVACDASLTVVASGGDRQLLGPEAATCVGMSLWDLFPSLVGERERVQMALTGVHTEFQVGSFSLRLQPHEISSYGEVGLLGVVRKTASQEISLPAPAPASTRLAHELRSPLTTVMGYVEMLLDGDMGELSEEQIDALRVVAASSEKMLTVITHLLG